MAQSGADVSNPQFPILALLAAFEDFRKCFLRGNGARFSYDSAAGYRAIMTEGIETLKVYLKHRWAHQPAQQAKIAELFGERFEKITYMTFPTRAKSWSTKMHAVEIECCLGVEVGPPYVHQGTGEQRRPTPHPRQVGV